MKMGIGFGKPQMMGIGRCCLEMSLESKVSTFLLQLDELGNTVFSWGGKFGSKSQWVHNLWMA